MSSVAVMNIILAMVGLAKTTDIMLPSMAVRVTSEC